MVDLIIRLGRALLWSSCWLLSAGAVADPLVAGSARAGGAGGAGGTGEYLSSLLRYRDNADFRFRDRILSPLAEADRIAFTGLNYYDAQPMLVLAASFEAAADRSTFAMPTFNRKTLSYSHYGTLETVLAGQVVRLKAFRREENDGFRNILLVPFRDQTNGTETYAGGRYMELPLPLPRAPVIDFNRAMNPLCAYDPSYACPIPPPENRLMLPVRAGEKRYH